MKMENRNLYQNLLYYEAILNIQPKDTKNVEKKTIFFLQYDMTHDL